MTQRKPSDLPIHTWVDKLIREAQERGEFDDLPGSGKPLPGIDGPLEEDWWVKQKVRSEELPTEALLPPALRLRRELAALPETVRHLRDEAAVRAAVREVNLRVAEYIRIPTGPVLPVAPADPDAVVARWRAERDGGARPDGGTAPGSGPEPAQRPGKPAPRRSEPSTELGTRRRWWWPWRRRPPEATEETEVDPGDR